MCAKVKLAVALTLSAGDRLARAQERLAETRGQLADVVQRTAAHRDAPHGLRVLLDSDLLAVRAAEHEVSAAEEATSDAAAAVLLAEGTEDEPAMRAASRAADAYLAACVAQLVQVQAAAVATEAKVAAETADVEALLAQDEKARRDLIRMVASLERQESQWHAAAGVERLAAAVRERQALDTRLAELRAMVRAAEADVAQSERDAAALAQEHPELAGSLEVRELRRDPMASFHEVIAAVLDFCAVLERHAGSQFVADFWHVLPHRDGPPVNVPWLLKAGFDSEPLQEFFGPLAAHHLPRVQGMLGGLVMLARYAREDEAQSRSGLPRVLGEVEAEPAAAADENEGDETPPAA